MKFSARSQSRLNTCHPDLIRLFEAVISDGHDCTVIEGHRDQATQDEHFRAGRSKKQWPNGKHNTTPSQAVDVMPFPIDWSDRARLERFAQTVFAKANQLGIAIRWGGDWNRNGLSSDEKFFDGPHWELVTPNKPTTPMV
jgi:peptidoglycan LD-endopeptidase CwlK